MWASSLNRLNRALYTATWILECAEQRQYQLTRTEYQTLAVQNQIIAKFGSPEVKVEYYALIVAQVTYTKDGTAEHGHYLALQQHFYQCCKHFYFDVSSAFKQQRETMSSPQVSPAA